jgi:hypothetical protein
MPSADRKLELKAKTSVAQTGSQPCVYAKGLKKTLLSCQMAWGNVTSVTAICNRNKQGSTITIHIWLHGSSCIQALTIWRYFTATLIKRHSYRYWNFNSGLLNAMVLSHHQFQNFVEASRSAHDNTFYPIAVRWLSKGVVLDFLICGQ